MPIRYFEAPEIKKHVDQLAEECETTGGEDACSQLVITSIAEIVIALAQVGQENGISINDDDGISSSDAVAIANIVSSNPDIQVDTTGDGTPDTTLLSVIAVNASNTIDYISYSPFEGTGIGDVINDQVQAIGGADCGSGSVACISDNELETYLNNTYGK